MALAGGAWTIVFGILFGELFGDLGKRIFGDFAVWMYRPSAAALEPLLLFAVAIGAVHVVLGIAIGAWQAARFSEHRTMFDKLGTLLALGGLFGVAGWAAEQLPPGALTPAVAATVVGLVLVMSLHGALGLVTGPLEFMGTLETSSLTYGSPQSAWHRRISPPSRTSWRASDRSGWAYSSRSSSTHSTSPWPRSARRSRRCVSITWSSSARSSSAAAARSGPSGMRRGNETPSTT